MNHCNIMYKYKPQSNSVSAGLFMLTISGIHLGWSTWGFLDVAVQSTTDETSLNHRIPISSAWFVGAIIGSIAGAVLVNRWRKKTLYYLCEAMLIISSTLLIALPTVFGVIVFSRLLAGFAHGIVYLTTIIHAAEICSIEMRGCVLGMIGFWISTGVLVSTTIIGSTMNHIRIYGIMALIIALLALLVTKWLTYESPLFLIRNGHEQDAEQVVVKMHGETIQTDLTHRHFQEICEMVDEEKSQGTNLLVDGNFRILILMMFVRLLKTLTNNMLINIILWGLSINLYQEIELIGIVLTVSRTLGCLLTTITLCWIGRKVHLTVSGIGAALVILTFAILSTIPSITENVELRYLPGMFCLLFELFIGIGIEPVSHVYMGEAFLAQKSAWSITVINCVDYLIGIGFIVLSSIFFTQVRATVFVLVLFATAIVVFVLTIVFQFVLPETRTLSLRLARNIFCKRNFSDSIYTTRSMQGITF